jgi:hypothetical protein
MFIGYFCYYLRISSRTWNELISTHFFKADIICGAVKILNAASVNTAIRFIRDLQESINLMGWPEFFIKGFSRADDKTL